MVAKTFYLPSLDSIADSMLGSHASLFFPKSLDIDKHACMSTKFQVHNS